MRSSTPGHPPTSSPRRSRWWLAPLTVAAALVLQWAWVESRQLLQPTGEAVWIWSGRTTRWTGPWAIYAFRDFTLEEVPPGASLTVLGDEEYVLYLNGERVGSNRYTPAAPPDLYEVGNLLVEGDNRLVAHLRSSRGFGAFLLTLTAAGSEQPLLVTDREWQISRRYFKRLLRPDLKFDGRLEAAVLGRPPFGRWGTLRAAEPRPLHAELRADYRPVAPRRVSVAGRDWQHSAGETRRADVDLSQRVLLDWGGVIEGYLTLEMPQEQPIVGLAYLGLGRPDPVRQAPDAYIVWTPGQPYWEDVVPRRFRFALLVGVGGASNPRVVVTQPSRVQAVEAGRRPPGVLGLAAPRLVSPLENEVWRELERFPRHTER